MERKVSDKSKQNRNEGNERNVGSETNKINVNRRK
jgi:hypothetical protein